MNEELKGGIEAGASQEVVNQEIDPELADDRTADEEENAAFELPEYDPSQFEEPDDEYDGGEE